MNAIVQGSGFTIREGMWKLKTKTGVEALRDLNSVISKNEVLDMLLSPSFDAYIFELQVFDPSDRARNIPPTAPISIWKPNCLIDFASSVKVVGIIHIACSKAP